MDIRRRRQAHTPLPTKSCRCAGRTHTPPACCTAAACSTSDTVASSLVPSHSHATAHTRTCGAPACLQQAAAARPRKSQCCAPDTLPGITPAASRGQTVVALCLNPYGGVEFSGLCQCSACSLVTAAHHTTQTTWIHRRRQPAPHHTPKTARQQDSQPPCLLTKCAAAHAPAHWSACGGTTNWAAKG